MPTDGYALAIPVSRLQSTALEVAPECGCHSDADLERCAATVVRSQVCPCLLGAPCVLDAVASKLCTWIRNQDAAQATSVHRVATPRSRLVAAREPA